MLAGPVARHVLVTQRIEEVSGIRPITLLIASGIALITAIPIVTGIAANHLRDQALTMAASELARIDNVLAAASNRSLRVADARLAEVADQLSRAAAGDAARLREVVSAPEIGARLRGELGRSAPIDGIALIAADGVVLDHAGAWPAAELASRGFVEALRTQPARASIVGAAIRDQQTGTVSIPLAHRIDGPDTPLGAVVGMIPAVEFTSLFAAVPLAGDVVSMLLRPDGSILARYPEPPSTSADTMITDRSPDPVLGDITGTMIRHVPGKDSGGRIEALHALADYPATVLVSRSADQVLAEWAPQGLWFVGFALAGAVAVAIMVYLIARQFRTHAALAAISAEKAIAAIDAEKNEIERARLAAEAELLKSERLSVLGQLTATVAHELRNPLSAIRNTLFTIKELASGAATKFERPIARMERGIERCDRIISDLLEYTRNRDLIRTSVPFDHWVAEVVADQNVSPTVGLAAELAATQATVPIDRDRMRRVIINLVENAAQALAELPPDREKRIVLRTATADGELLLAIEDTGPGIAPEVLARIFEPLFSTKNFGTGLGLPTVKQIVSQHGGRIAVDSVVGRGTCVTVRLPLSAPAMEEVRVAA
ncbi:MAG: ATP-binding protein [Stellaceae bacterium]